MLRALQGDYLGTPKPMIKVSHISSTSIPQTLAVKKCSINLELSKEKVEKHSFMIMKLDWEMEVDPGRKVGIRVTQAVSPKDMLP